MKDVPNIAAQHRTDQLVGLRLSLMLDTFGMSRSRLARELAVENGTVDDYCAGQLRIGPDKVARIAALLSISAVALFMPTSDTPASTH